jgi:hypothetical protein
MTIREFNSIMMGVGDYLLICRKIAVAYLTLRRGQSKKPRCVMGSPFAKAISVPGKKQTTLSVLSGAAKPAFRYRRCATSFSPAAVGRDSTFCRL